MMKTTLHIFFMVILLSGCTTGKVSETLLDIESYITEHPDSALKVIEGIDRELLKTDGIRAHHALLHAMALD